MKASFLIKLLCGLSLLLAQHFAYAAGDHDHAKGPHGGVVVSFGDKYHIEGVKKGGEVRFYIIGEDGTSSASIGKHDGGSITVITPGKGQKKTELSAGESLDQASAPAPDKGKMTALVKLKVNGKNLSAKFNFKE